MLKSDFSYNNLSESRETNSGNSPEPRTAADLSSESKEVCLLWPERNHGRKLRRKNHGRKLRRGNRGRKLGEVARRAAVVAVPELAKTIGIPIGYSESSG